MSKVTEELKIVESSQQDKDYIITELAVFNNQHVPYAQAKHMDVNFVIKDSNMEIIAGINGYLYNWKILFISHLWIHESHRFKRLGSMLVRKVEEVARKANSTLIHLETYSFQAKEFYLKMGYEIFGILDDCPPGHTKYFFKKHLHTSLPVNQ